MAAEQVRQDLIANDLSNSQTAGYKSDRAVQRDFDEVLLSNRVDDSPVGLVGRGPAIEQRYTDLTPEPIRETDRPLDLAIQGTGYFAVRTAQGVRYTRNGEFIQQPDGTVTDATGNPLLSAGGQDVRVGAGGEVDPTTVGVYRLGNPVKAGANLFTGTAQGRDTGTVRTRALELAGVDAAQTMVDMIKSLRAYEAGQKVIQTIDQTLGKAASNVGAIR